MIKLPSNNIDENEVIDMSVLNFDIDDSKKKFAAFLYIRNCSIKNKLSFENCTYKDKEEYLLLFMKKDLSILDKNLIDTWVSILYGENMEGSSSILNNEEIKIFIKNNKEFLFNIKQFINSIILLKAGVISKYFNSNFNYDTKETEYSDLSVINIYNLISRHPYLFMHLTDSSIEVLYYNNLFNDKNLYYLNKLINEYSPFNEIISTIIGVINGNTIFNEERGMINVEY